MKRRKFIRYLVGVAATCGLALAGRVAYGSSISGQRIAKPGAGIGFQRSQSTLRAEGKPLIKVVGIGGAGARAVDHMIRDGLGAVEFVCVDTDAETLHDSSADTKLQLPAGLATGSQSTQELCDVTPAGRAQLAKMVCGADLVFIIAGMGGMTGTGVAVTVAETARDLGILTVALVTKPLESEGLRLALAEHGIAELVKHADAMIVTDNAVILSEMEDWGDPVTTGEAFETSDGCLSRWVSNLADMVNFPGLVGVEFADVSAVLRESGRTMAGRTGPRFCCGVGRGDDAGTQSVRTARYCAEAAISSAEMDGYLLSGARSILVTVMGDTSLGIDEVNEVIKQVRSRAAPDATVVVGTIHEDGMGDFLKVSVIAKGFDDPGVMLDRVEVPTEVNHGEVQIGSFS